MIRFRRSTNEWCVDYETFKAMDPGKIWERLTGNGKTPIS